VRGKARTAAAIRTAGMKAAVFELKTPVLRRENVHFSVRFVLFIQSILINNFESAKAGNSC